jgi:Icc-related predicted phosphoesterase
VSPVKPIVIADDVDVVVAAGDICEGAIEAFQHVRRIVPMQIPVIMVFGNHEFYRGFINEEIKEGLAIAHHFNIELLVDTTTVIGGVRFAGCTLWTDYRIFGDANQAAVMEACARGMNDHRLIGWEKKPWLRFRPQEAALLHSRSRVFLEEVLSTDFAGPSVVVTHHAVHWNSVHPIYREDGLTGAFVSDLSSMIETRGPALWVHGHVHNSSRYRLCNTLVVCNPHGYGKENPEFDGHLTIDIDGGGAHD